MKKKNKGDMKTITVLLFVATTFLWVALLCVKALVWGFNGEELADEIISNILGILPPMIIFNFLYEYLTKDHMADEMTEQITYTLMGNPQVMDSFEHDKKVAFVKNTINAIVSEESAEMVNAVVLPYITNQYNIRTFFKYTIILRDYEKSPLFDKEIYMRVNENLKYKKVFINDERIGKCFHVAFILSNHELDMALRKHEFIFQENLSIDEKELSALLALSYDEQMAFVRDEMNMSVYINDNPTTIQEVVFTENGIDIAFQSDHNVKDKEISVELNFAMPQRKGHSEFFVSINEPTYSPIIQLSYPETKMTVKPFSFLNDGDDTSVERATHNVGNYEFCIQDKWIYPMSGVVFVIDDKE